MITETQIEEYFRAKVEEFRARGVPVTTISTQLSTYTNSRLSWNLHASPQYCVVSCSSADHAYATMVTCIKNPATKAAELRAQAEQLLKSADELEGKV